MPTSVGAPQIAARVAKCTGCRICELRCSLRFRSSPNLRKAAISIRRLVGQETEYDISFADHCDSCGICARFCPYGALVQSQGGTA